MEPFTVHVLASDRPFYEGLCTSITIPSVDGEYGILAHHSNLILAMVPGTLRCQFPDREPETAAVSGGLVKVEDGEVLVLVDTIERPDEIDANRARRDAARAKEAILQKRSIQEYRSAQATLARAINRLRVKGDS